MYRNPLFQNDEVLMNRTCYTAMKHKEGDIVKVRDCVLLRSGPRKVDLPFVAKVAALWEDPESGNLFAETIASHYSFPCIVLLQLSPLKKSIEHYFLQIILLTVTYNAFNLRYRKNS